MSADLPSITIVTPCLNGLPTLPQALESVREQGYPQLEHVVVDGASSDGSLEVLEAADGIHFVSEPDRGLSHAMNKGIDLAKGEVVGWLNADDFYLPGALSSVGEAFAANPEALWVTGRCIIVDAGGQEIRRAVTAYKDFFLRRYSYRSYLMQNFISCPATFVRREAFDLVGALDERFRISMDYDLFLRLGRHAPPVVIDEPLAAFRMAEGSLSMAGFELQFSEHALNARQHGSGHAVPVLVNRAASRLIITTYRLLRLLRRRRRRRN